MPAEYETDSDDDDAEVDWDQFAEEDSQVYSYWNKLQEAAAAADSPGVWPFVRRRALLRHCLSPAFHRLSPHFVVVLLLRSQVAGSSGRRRRCRFLPPFAAVLPLRSPPYTAFHRLSPRPFTALRCGSAVATTGAFSGVQLHL